MSLRFTLARIGRWPRLAAAAACLLLAAVTALEDAGRGDAAAPGHTRAVLVAARALPVGHHLTRRDLATARWPAQLAPPGTTRDPRALLDRVLAGPLARGEPVTPRRLVDAGLTAGLGPDVVAVPVDVDTDVRGLVRAGDRVDLLAVPRPESVDPGHATAVAPADPVARSARVLAVTVLPAGLGTDAGGCRLVLAVVRGQAVRIAGLRPARLFTVVLTSP